MTQPRPRAVNPLLYFLSMLELGALWFGHRNAFEYIRRTDHPHTWLSLAMLTLIPLRPWTVSQGTAARSAEVL